jgi:hypothetical protein
MGGSLFFLRQGGFQEISRSIIGKPAVRFHDDVKFCRQASDAAHHDALPDGKKRSGKRAVPREKVEIGRRRLHIGLIKKGDVTCPECKAGYRQIWQPKGTQGRVSVPALRGRQSSSANVSERPQSGHLNRENSSIPGSL